MRSTHNRRVRVGHDGQGKQVLLHAYPARWPQAGGRRRADPKTKEQRRGPGPGLAQAVEILPPHVRKGEYEKIPIPAWAVRVWEETPPDGGTAVEWLLLQPVTTAEDAWQQCAWYGCRWIIEELHKAKKTGCQIEDLQFHTEAALQPMIALLSVVAVMLLNLREAAGRQEDAATRPAAEVVRRSTKRSSASGVTSKSTNPSACTSFTWRWRGSAAT